MFSRIKNYSREFIIVLVYFWAYGPIWIWMWERWFARDSYYSHGILIPFVTLYLIWQKKEVLKKTPREPAGWGIVFLVFGILVLLLSSLLRVYFLGGFSLIIVLVGLILGFYGKGVLSKILFPICFLAFMVPLPEVLIAEISFDMKIFAAQIAAYILNHHLHLPALREGSLIKMSHTYVMVDDVCSGLRSLISLTALGSIFAYEMKGAFYKKLFVFALTVPIAIITNVFRIIILSSISETWGAQYAMGFVHVVSGFLVFALAFVLLLVTVKLLK